MSSICTASLGIANIRRKILRSFSTSVVRKANTSYRQQEGNATIKTTTIPTFFNDVVAQKNVPSCFTTTISIWKKRGSPVNCSNYFPMRLLTSRHEVEILQSTPAASDDVVMRAFRYATFF